MDKRNIAIGAGGIALAVGAIGVLGASSLPKGVQMAPGLDSLFAWLTGGGGIAMILGVISKFVPALGSVKPELFQSLVAWLANKSDKQVERRFALAALDALAGLDAVKARPDIKKMITDIGHALLDSWLPITTPDAGVSK